MSKTKGKRVKLLKGEKIIYFLLVAILISIPLISVFTKAMLSQTNIELEKVKDKIEIKSLITEIGERKNNGRGQPAPQNASGRR